jgi:hypothetical protein
VKEGEKSMNAMGIGGKWHEGEPQTEATAFARILPLGGETIMSGSLLLGSSLCFPSRALKDGDTLSVFCLDAQGTARTLIAHKGDETVFASALSLAW